MPNLEAFCAELSRRASEQHAPAVEGVTLASLHAAKGLEWDAVFLVGLADGTLPTTFARTETALEEERRLLYVGITRARERLQLSYGLARNAGGRERRLCRFLAPLGLGGFPRLPSPARRPRNRGSARRPRSSTAPAAASRSRTRATASWGIATIAPPLWMKGCSSGCASGA